MKKTTINRLCGQSSWKMCMRLITCPFTLVIVFAFSACGGGGSSASTSHSQSLPPPVTLQSIKIISKNPYVSTGESMQLTAQAAYSDASIKDVTSSVTWSSSDTGVATIDGSGSAKGVAPGTANITATYQGNQASMSLTVGDQVGGTGATVPWVEYEAEDGTTNGTVIGPSRKQGEMAAEASGRKAVKLDQTGQYVSFTTTAKANSIVVRYIIPDSASGGGINATLGLYVNGTRVQSLNLTSKYAWLYSSNNSSTFWTDNTPGSYPHHFYDEIHTLTAEIPAGATVILQKDSQDTAAYYVIDLVDLEQVAAPLTQPAGSISITDYGAVPDDGVDDSAAIQQAASNAQSQGKTLWIPAGIFNMDSAELYTQSIKIQGAGIWYSVLSGAKAGIITSGNNNQFSDFAIFGDQTARDPSSGINGFSGTEGTGSSIKNVWVEHEQVGAWIVGTDNPLSGSTVPQTTDGLLMSGVRFRDTMADGMDFASGTSNSVIEQSTFRNTGDDSMGAYSAPDGSKADAGDTFQFNTVQAPWVAHCMAAYGGKDITFEDNMCSDSDEGGIAIAAAFNAYAFAGTTTIERNSLIRICSDEFDGRTCGALTLAPGEKAISNTTVVKDVLIQDPTSDGILVTGPNTLSGVTFDNVQVNNAGGDGVYVNSDAVGSGSATALIVKSPTGTGLDNLSNGNWTLTNSKWNSGW